MRITHVTPHLGGGVGRVILNYLCRMRGGPDEHELWCLDYANQGARERAEKAGLKIFDRLGTDYGRLAAAVRAADIVVAHWWNHPLIYAWFMNGRPPDCRLLLWSHVSGHSSPQVFTPALAAFPDIFAVSTPHSFTVPALTVPALAVPALAAAEKKRPRLLFSCGGLEQVAGAAPRPHPGFRVGYLGTVDYVKMHPRFLALSLAADLPEARFIVAGGPRHRELAAEAAALGAAARFDILGPIEDIETFYSELDIFGCPLNPRHYGTGEQCLIEAQAAGVPPVVLAGGAEAYVVEDGVTGLAAPSEAEYPRCLELLRRDDELRLRLSRQAQKRARERFDLAATARGFEELYRELMEKPKSPKPWPGRPANAPPFSAAEIFLASQGELGKLFVAADAAGADAEELFGSLGPADYAETRGSVFHYRSFFPGDPLLERLSSVLAACPHNSRAL